MIRFNNLKKQPTPLFNLYAHCEATYQSEAEAISKLRLLRRPFGLLAMTKTALDTAKSSDTMRPFLKRIAKS